MMSLCCAARVSIVAFTCVRLAIIHLVECPQNFPKKKQYFLPHERTRVCPYKGVRNAFFFENIAYVLNG